MAVTAKEKKEIRKNGFAYTGGIPKQTYWTPDGREIQSIPSMREFNRKDSEGNITGTGTRDANLDRGWLLSPPKDPKPYCAGCDKWHDTEEEVIKCIAERAEKARQWEDWAKKEKEGNGVAQEEEVEGLRVEVLELRGLIHELTQMIKEVGE